MHNAIKYSKPSEAIEIYIEEADRGIRVNIKDHGVGISEKDIRQIWNRFYKVPGAEVDVKKGTGLGLSIVKNILERHQFKYGLESRLGVGTNVWVEMFT